MDHNDHSLIQSVLVVCLISINHRRACCAIGYMHQAWVFFFSQA